MRRAGRIVHQNENSAGKIGIQTPSPDWDKAVTEAAQLRETGDLAAARSLLESLERTAPNHPAILFHLASLWLDLGNLRLATRYAKRIDPTGTDPAFQRMLEGLSVRLTTAKWFTPLLDKATIADGRREDADEKPISLTLSLLAALRQLPVEWLNAIANRYQVAPTRLRSERERALTALLQDRSVILEALHAEDQALKTILEEILQSGGWCKLAGLTRRFGPMHGDGFFWDKQPPVSPIGRLRVLGLVYVGRAAVDGKQQKAAVIPVDLRTILERL